MHDPRDGTGNAFMNPSGGLPSVIPMGRTSKAKANPATRCFVFFHDLHKASFVLSFKTQNHPDVSGVICFGFAERGGFEPPVQLPIRQFSKLLV